MNEQAQSERAEPETKEEMWQEIIREERKLPGLGELFAKITAAIKEAFGKS